MNMQPKEEINLCCYKLLWLGYYLWLLHNSARNKGGYNEDTLCELLNWRPQGSRVSAADASAQWWVWDYSGEQQEKRTTCGHVNQTPLTWFLDYNWASEMSNCKSNRCKNFNWVKILNWIHFKTRCDCYLELIRNLPIACLKAAELCNFNFLRK